MVNQMQGRISTKTTSINLNGKPISCPVTLANSFADYFEGKIKKLKGRMPGIK